MESSRRSAWYVENAFRCFSKPEPPTPASGRTSSALSYYRSSLRATVRVTAVFDAWSMRCSMRSRRMKGMDSCLGLLRWKNTALGMKTETQQRTWVLIPAAPQDSCCDPGSCARGVTVPAQPSSWGCGDKPGPCFGGWEGLCSARRLFLASSGSRSRMLGRQMCLFRPLSCHRALSAETGSHWPLVSFLSASLPANTGLITSQNGSWVKRRDKYSIKKETEFRKLASRAVALRL